jgi:N-acetylglucosaminyl-diphospho-decaprenol L-rhamnosyltransferase
MDLSIVIVNWNSADYLRTCLRTIHDTARGIAFEIIVVDNASTVGGLDEAVRVVSGVTVIALPRNLGFSGANNVGLRQAHGECVLLLNPDTEVVGSAIQTMLDQVKVLPCAGVIGCCLLNSDETIQLTATQFPTIVNQLLDIECLQRWWPDCPLWRLGPLFERRRVTEVESIPGACMMLKRDVIQRVGLLSEDYFMYAEDIDLSLQVRRAGYRNYHVGSSTVIHHGGKSSARRSASSWSTAMKCQSMLTLFRKHRGAVYGAAYRAALGWAAGIRLLLLATAMPLGGVVFDRVAIRNATAKWATVFRWAVGAIDVQN